MYMTLIVSSQAGAGLAPVADRNDDAELERRAIGGDAGAFGQIIRMHERDLRGLAWSVVRDNHQADDVLQTAFEKAFRRIKTFNGDGSLKAWLQSICYRAALDHIRYEGRRRHQNIEHIASPPSTDDVATEVEIAQRFEAVMASLDPETRALMMLTAGLGHTAADAARITNIPVGTVNSRLSRAKRRLRKEAS